MRHRTLIGAWCFLDHYGPDDVVRTGGMEVAPHPHTGLQTVSWLFAGEVEHRDSGGAYAIIQPGLTGLMTSGFGIAHSEVSTPATTVLHGVQLWVALPSDALNVERDFSFTHAPMVALDEAKVTVFVGSLLGVTSDAKTYTPLVGAELNLEPGATIELPVDKAFEHGLLVDTGAAAIQGTAVRRHELAYVAPGESALVVTNLTDDPARFVLIGGTPFEEPIVMWWNFVARSHEEIVEMRDEWQAGSERFGFVPEYYGTPMRLAAPPMPRVHLLPRSNPPRPTA